MKESQQYRAQSRERLKKLVTGKQRTTMIGALDRIENILGFLWGDDKFKQNDHVFENDLGIDIYNTIVDIQEIWDDSRLTPAQKRKETEIRFKLLFQALRSAILNLGNNNIRDSEKEIDMYDVSWKKYTMNLQVRNPKNG